MPSPANVGGRPLEAPANRTPLSETAEMIQRISVRGMAHVKIRTPDLKMCGLAFYTAATFSYPKDGFALSGRALEIPQDDEGQRYYGGCDYAAETHGHGGKHTGLTVSRHCPRRADAMACQAKGKPPGRHVPYFEQIQHKCTESRADNAGHDRYDRRQ